VPGAFFWFVKPTRRLASFPFRGITTKHFLVWICLPAFSFSWYDFSVFIFHLISHFFDHAISVSVTTDILVYLLGSPYKGLFARLNQTVSQSMPFRGIHTSLCKTCILPHSIQSILRILHRYRMWYMLGAIRDIVVNSF
jgi:hypothetical protein